jgi:signal transduction histidine kinase
MERAATASRSPSIRRLIRQGLAVQIGLSILILIAVLIAFVLRVQLVDQQERGTRGIGELRSASVALLTTIEAIDKYSRLAEADQLATYRGGEAELRSRLEQSIQWLEGPNRAAIGNSITAVDNWRKTVLEPVVSDVQRGDRASAQARLLSPRNDQQVSTIGLLVTKTMDQSVKNQLRSERSSRKVVIISAGVIGAALLALIAGALAFLLPLRRRVVVPLEDIARASKSIGDGDFSARVDNQGVHETELAAIAFNQMADIVEHHIDEYEHLDDLKDQFIAAASHELRTPITSIRGYIEMHLDGEVGEITDDQRRNLEVVQRNALQLGELIDDLLTLSSVNQQGSVTLVTERCDLAEILAEVSAELRPLASESEIAISKSCAGDLHINGDRTRLRRIFLNIISNAIKFSKPGGRVTIDAERLGAVASVRVVDGGIGIAAEDLPRLGQRFFRAQSARDTHGTGLGLSIANELIAMHDGDLRIESTIGEGSTFTVMLPVAGPQRAPVALTEHV